MTESWVPAPGAESGAGPGVEQVAAPELDAPARSALVDVLETVLVAVIVVLFAATFIVQNSVIPTPSMADTLLVGDYVLVDKVGLAPVDAARPTRWCSQRPIRAGDVVVFKSPKDPSSSYVKRVVALPGQVVEIRAKQVFLDGAALEERHALHASAIVQPGGSGPGASTRDNLAPVRVPEDCYFVMGDNRDYSSDSREWGCVPRRLVTGRAVLVLWSVERRPGSWQAQGLARIRQAMRTVTAIAERTRWERVGRPVR